MEHERNNEFQRLCRVDRMLVEQRQIEQKEEKKARQRMLKRELYKKDPTRRKGYQKDYQRRRKNEDPTFRLANIMRSRLCNELSLRRATKTSKMHEILGCSFTEFRSYIEARWQPWMSWDNYGKFNGKENYGWDLDHIVEMQNAKTPDDVRRLNHFTNLQPLCSFVNRVTKRLANK